MASPVPPPRGGLSSVDALHVLFGGLGGQLGVVRGLAETMGRAGLRSAAISYTPPGEHLREEVIWEAFDHVRFIDKRTRIDLVGARMIGRAIRDLRPRALLLHSPYAPLATLRAKLTGAVSAVVLVEHTTLAVRTLGDEVRSLIALGAAPAVVLLTQDHADRLPIGRILRRFAARIQVIPNGIDVTKFAPGGTDGCDGPPILGMAARLNPLKDTATLVSAVAELRRRGVEVRLRIAGDGPSREELERLAEALGIRDCVRFEGMLDETKLAAWLRELDLYVHASNGETMSTSVLQALATGLPCVLSDAPGLIAFASGRDGEGALLSPPGDAIRMADAVVELLSDSSRMRSMGERNRSRCVREHSLEGMALGYLSLLADTDPEGLWAEAHGRLVAAES
jgi:glycosyltransferase involved in cell wall biosynthesis